MVPAPKSSALQPKFQLQARYLVKAYLGIKHADAIVCKTMVINLYPFYLLPGPNRFRLRLLLGLLLLSL